MRKIEIESIDLQVNETDYYAGIFISYSGVVGRLHDIGGQICFWLFRPIADYNDEHGHIEKIHVLKNTIRGILFDRQLLFEL